MSDKRTDGGVRISFLFQPFEYEQSQHAVEKAMDGGKKRRYLRGITSGCQVDGHGEKITKDAISSFHDQANKGDILLYADKHGINYTEDIGKLTKSEVLSNGDWMTEYRLYDAEDGVGPSTLEKADKAWKQIGGLPPYKYPRQYGFSIEGFIPDDGILKMDVTGKRIINSVLLDGVVLVPRPAYQTSIAQSIYKALDEITPWNLQKSFSSMFKGKLEADDILNAYYRRRYQYQDLLESEIDTLMSSNAVSDKKEALNNLFTEYKDVMIELILSSTSLFGSEGGRNASSDGNIGENTEAQILDLYKSKNKNPVASESQKIQVIKGLIKDVDRMIQKFQ
jgi:hypothetical protein